MVRRGRPWLVGTPAISDAATNASPWRSVALDEAPVRLGNATTMAVGSYCTPPAGGGGWWSGAHGQGAGREFRRRSAGAESALDERHRGGGAGDRDLAAGGGAGRVPEAGGTINGVVE